MAPAASITDVCEYRPAHGALSVRAMNVTPAAHESADDGRAKNPVALQEVVRSLHSRMHMRTCLNLCIYIYMHTHTHTLTHTHTHTHTRTRTHTHPHARRCIPQLLRNVHGWVLWGTLVLTTSLLPPGRTGTSRSCCATRTSTRRSSSSTRRSCSSGAPPGHSRVLTGTHGYSRVLTGTHGYSPTVASIRHTAGSHDGAYWDAYSGVLNHGSVASARPRAGTRARSSARTRTSSCSCCRG